MQQPLDVPKISSDKDKSIRELRNYVIDLTDYLRYKLNHLEVENFTEESKQEIRAVKTQPPAVVGVTNKYVLERITEAIEEATALITGHEGGHVVLNPSEMPEEILIMDSPSIETSQNVWRWNGAGLGFSSTGYDGTYNLAMTMNGAINASFITTGSLVAIDITGSTITGAEITGSIIAGSDVIGSGFYHCPPQTQGISTSGAHILDDLNDGSKSLIVLLAGATASDFPVNSYVNIGTAPYLNDIASDVKILAHDGGHLIIYRMSERVNIHITKTNVAMNKPFTVYGVPIVDYSNIGSYANKIIGGVDYAGGEVRLYSKEWTVSGSTTIKPAVSINSPSAVIVETKGGFIRIANHETTFANSIQFLKNGKKYAIDPYDSVGIGQPALIRIS